MKFKNWMENFGEPAEFTKQLPPMPKDQREVQNWRNELLKMVNQIRSKYGRTPYAKQAEDREKEILNYIYNGVLPKSQTPPPPPKGSYEKPVSQEEVQPTFTGWVDTGTRQGFGGHGLRYYVDGEPANGFVSIPPELRPNTGTAAADGGSFFNDGWETDF